MRHAGHVGAQAVALAVEIDGDRLHLSEVAHRIGPRHLYRGRVEPALQIDFETQGQEAGDDVPDTGVVAVMEDGPDLQRGLRGRCARPARGSR
jgi:hypothetical protein